MTTLNRTEHEIIVLEATLETINSMVNFSVLHLNHSDPDSSIYFEDHIKQHHFSLLFIDLLKSPGSSLFGMTKPYVDMLEDICNNPSFNHNKTIDFLKRPTQALKHWLSEEMTIKKMWFPSIDLEIDLKLRRSDFCYIGGIITKHNFTRQSFVAGEMQKILQANSVTKSKEDCLLVLEDFYNWFHGDGNIFICSSQCIAEFLNNIRWGIYRYLQTEFNRSYTQGPSVGYSFIYPTDVINPLAQKYYWDLMNNVRSKPYFPEFLIADHFRKYC